MNLLVVARSIISNLGNLEVRLTLANKSNIYTCLIHGEDLGRTLSVMMRVDVDNVVGAVVVLDTDASVIHNAIDPDNFVTTEVLSITPIKEKV